MAFLLHGSLARFCRRRQGLSSICAIALTVFVIYRIKEEWFSVQSVGRSSSRHSDREMDLSKATSPFVGWPLARVCNETAWVPGLVFMCDNNSGGIGNIRNYILTCIRYAIEAGATGLVMPQIRTRSSTQLSDIMLEYRPFDYFFDELHFRKSLTTHCPSITIYSSTDEIPNNPHPSRAEPVTPWDYGSRAGCDQRDLNRHANLFGERFRSWLQQSAEQFNLPSTSWEHPRVIRFNWGVQWDFPVYLDGPEFVATFGGLLRFRDDILALGGELTDLIRHRTRRNRPMKLQNGFAGVHLRTENDALATWPNFDAQSSAYSERVAELGFGTVYLATGNKTEAAKLKATLHSRYNIAVMTKSDLLADQARDLKRLDSWTWDQQALVDFIVLLEADFFLGVSPSSFSMNVALKRHLQLDGLNTRPWKVGTNGDGRSWLVGAFERYWDDWLFMYESLWP